ncbi:MAG: hypothetical protein ACKVQK_08450 [Burkholderiales bacterium]
MFEHLRYLQGEVQPHSFAGAFTEEKLDLNDPDIVEFRSSLITMLAATNSQIDLAKTILEDAQAALDAAATEETRAIAREIYDQADKNLNKLQAAITQVLG